MADVHGNIRKFSLEVGERIRKYSETFILEQDETVGKIKDVREQIFRAIGEFGKWQLIKCVYIIFIIWMPASFHLLNMVFYRAPTDHWCAPPDGINNGTWSSNDTGNWRHLAGPIKSDGKIEVQCEMYDINWLDIYQKHQGNWDLIKNDVIYHEAIEKKLTRTCEKHEFDKSFWKLTIIQEFNLVCKDKPKQKWTQQITFFGLLCGVFVSGLLSDRIGRKKTILLLMTTTIISGTATAFSPSYEWFLVGIFLSNFSTLGMGTVMYTWMMEILSGREKTIFGAAPHLNYAFWGLTVAIVAYFIPNWRTMELVFSLPLILLYATYWVLPESPRWLLAQGRTEEAKSILRKIADFNKKPLDPNFQLSPPPKQGSGGGRGILGFLELFKTPNLRMKTLIIYYLWFSTSMVYYGLTLNSNNVGNYFVTYSVGKVMEFPACFLVIILLLKAGRRLTLLILYLICGFSLLATMAIPEGNSDNEWLIVVFNILGRASSIGTLAICYIYSAEIFPTVVRNVGIGSSSVWARISPMIAPYIADNLKVYGERVPLVIFGLVALFAGFLVSFLPETADHKLPDTIAEGEAMGQGDTLWKCFKKRSSTNTKTNSVQGKL